MKKLMLGFAGAGAVMLAGLFWVHQTASLAEPERVPSESPASDDTTHTDEAVPDYGNVETVTSNALASGRREVTFRKEAGEHTVRGLGTLPEDQKDRVRRRLRRGEKAWMQRYLKKVNQLGSGDGGEKTASDVIGELYALMGVKRYEVAQKMLEEGGYWTFSNKTEDSSELGPPGASERITSLNAAVIDGDSVDIVFDMHPHEFSEIRQLHEFIRQLEAVNVTEVYETLNSDSLDVRKQWIEAHYAGMAELKSEAFRALPASKRIARRRELWRKRIPLELKVDRENYTVSYR